MAAMLSLGQTTGCKFVSFTGTWIYRTLCSFFLRQKDIRKWTPNTATYKDKTISYFMSCGRLICRQFIFWLKIQEIVQIMFFSHSNEPIVSPGQSEGPVKIGGRFKFKIHQKNCKTFHECNVRYHKNYIHSNMNINNHELTQKRNVRTTACMVWLQVPKTWGVGLRWELPAKEQTMQWEM